VGTSGTVTLREAARRLGISLRVMRDFQQTRQIPAAGRARVGRQWAGMYRWDVLEQAWQERPLKASGRRRYDTPTDATLAALWQVLDHIMPVKIS